MAISRAQKEQDAEYLRTEFAEIPHAILVDFKGLDVAAATDLRRKLRASDAQFKVVKNSIALRAMEGMPLAELNGLLVGQTAIAYTDGDVVSLAKTLREFAEEFDTPTFKGGIVDGAPISADEFEQLAKLPRELDSPTGMIFVDLEDLIDRLLPGLVRSQCVDELEVLDGFDVGGRLLPDFEMLVFMPTALSSERQDDQYDQCAAPQQIRTEDSVHSAPHRFPNAGQQARSAVPQANPGRLGAFPVG